MTIFGYRDYRLPLTIDRKKAQTHHTTLENTPTILYLTPVSIDLYYPQGRAARLSAAQRRASLLEIGGPQSEFWRSRRKEIVICSSGFVTFARQCSSFAAREGVLQLEAQ